MRCGALGVHCLHLCKHFVGFYRRPKSIVQDRSVVDRTPWNSVSRRSTKYKHRRGNQSHQLSAREIKTIYGNNDDGLQQWRERIGLMWDRYQRRGAERWAEGTARWSHEEDGNVEQARDVGRGRLWSWVSWIWPSVSARPLYLV